VEAAADAIRGRVDGAQVEGHPLDLQSKRSIAAFASRVATTTGGSIDVLVNNAGVHLDLLSRWKEPSLSDDGFETQWRINYLGTAHLTHLLLPFLRNAAARTHDARIVNVVSKLHVRGANDDLFDRVRPYSSWDAYGNSKLALVHFTLELQRRFSSEGLQAYCLHPGSVFTNVAARGLENTGFIETLRNAMAPVEAFFLRTPAEGAQTQVHCATAAGVPGGLYYEDCKPATASDQADDPDVSLRLWRETSAWVAGETSDASLNA
ncbi:MAG: SDR family NAD(P)-dependent oxidoreductase, partial [Polyangiales bacterium]